MCFFQSQRAAVAAALVAVSSASSAASLVATYQFNNSFAADQAGAPALVPVHNVGFVVDTAVMGQTRTVAQRSLGNASTTTQAGLQLNTTALGLASTGYAVEIVFDLVDNYSPNNNYRRVTNSNGADKGFYVGGLTQQLDIYDGGDHIGGGSIANGTYYDVVLNVTPTGEQAYLNGALSVSYGGTADALTGDVLSFFLDNTSEYGNGRVALIRVFSGSLSAGDVATLYNGGNPFPAAVPEPGTWALFAAGLSGVAGLARHRRASAVARD